MPAPSSSPARRERHVVVTPAIERWAGTCECEDSVAEVTLTIQDRNSLETAVHEIRATLELAPDDGGPGAMIDMRGTCTSPSEGYFSFALHPLSSMPVGLALDGLAGWTHGDEFKWVVRPSTCELRLQPG